MKGIAVNKIEVFKKAVKIVISAGASTIVRQIIENNVETERTIDKVTVPIASVAIGGAVGNIAGQYTDAGIDEAVEFWNKIRDRNSAE
jgi:hypothetical protein